MNFRLYVLKYTVKVPAYSTSLYSVGTALRSGKRHLFKRDWCWLVELLCDSPCCHRTDHYSHLFWMLETTRLCLGMWCLVQRYQHFRINLLPSSSFQTEVWVSRFLWNCGTYLWHCRTSHHKRPGSLYSLPLGPQMWCIITLNFRVSGWVIYQILGIQFCSAGSSKMLH